MKTTSGLSILALVAALSAGPALANTGAAPAIGSFNDFLAAFETGVLVTPSSDLSNVSGVAAIAVDVAFPDFDRNAFEQALSYNSAKLADLQRALRENQALNAYLDGNDISVSDVVGIDNNQDGSLLIYTKSEV